MLTRLEVDGFKNLVDFTVDFAPYTCIAGPNGVGKSNIFDAIRFLSLLADHTLTEAALMVRGSGVGSGDVRELFWSNNRARQDTFRIAAEMIIDPDVRDDFGRPAQASSTYLRYEIKVGYEGASLRGSLGRLVLLSESLDYIKEGAAASRLKFPLSPLSFRKSIVSNNRRTPSGYISARKAVDGQVEILVHQDGGSRGLGQTASAGSAPRTIVATSNTSATPTILATRREMQKWRFLALEPTAMRSPDRFHTDPHVTQSGGHLAATLNRLGNDAEIRHDDRDSIFAAIANRLRELVSITGIDVEIDEVRQLLTIQAAEDSGIKLPAASLSDGTLRFLALAVLVADSEAVGVVCIEEPENGIHPAKMPQMVRLLHDLAVDANVSPGPDNPFRQVIIATHSPAFVQLQNHNDLLFAIETRIKGPDGNSARTLRCKPLEGTWRAKSGASPVGMVRCWHIFPLRLGRNLSFRKWILPRFGVKIHFVFVGEGSSDDGLIPHLQGLCLDAGAEEVTGVAPDLARLAPEGRLGIEARLRLVLTLEPSANLVFVHRDADSRSSKMRYAEIGRAVASSSCEKPVVAVVPVQETEAWLLLSEQSIRQVVGRPNGTTRLKLPKPRSVERVARPKERLMAALVLAGEVSGRRLERLRTDFPQHRRALLEKLQVTEQLEGLPSWRRLREDIREVLRQGRSSNV